MFVQNFGKVRQKIRDSLSVGQRNSSALRRLLGKSAVNVHHICFEKALETWFRCTTFSSFLQTKLKTKPLFTKTKLMFSKTKPLFSKTVLLF